MSKEEQEGWLHPIQKKELTVRNLEAALAEKKALPKEKKDSFAKVEEEALRRLLGVDIQITQKKDHSGHIKMAFSNLEDYQRLINILKKACE